MKLFTRKIWPLLGGLAVVALLAACGGTSSPSDVTQKTSPTASSDNTTVESSTVEGLQKAIDFTLPRAAGDPLSLNSYRGSQNVAVVFYRGFW
ncbi:MAG: hypothetical protein HQ475_11315 [SAR202 cluster bacterium]|nr:hypothetical protein [SAR202 cluster bacterium]